MLRKIALAVALTWAVANTGAAEAAQLFVDGPTGRCLLCEMVWGSTKADSSRASQVEDQASNPERDSGRSGPACDN